MPNYRYQFRDAHGAIHEDTVEANSVADAVQQIAREDRQLVAIRQVDLPVWEGGPDSVPHTRGNQLAALETPLRAVLTSGHALIPALRAYRTEFAEYRESQHLKSVIEAMERGGDAAQLLRQGKVKPSWIPALWASVSSGQLDPVIRWLGAKSQRDSAIRRLWSALAYPAVVVCLACVVLLFLLVWVVPVFREVYNDFGTELPWLTRLLTNLSSIVLDYGLVLLVLLTLGLIGSAFAARRIITSPWWDTIAARLPVLGHAYQMAGYARYSQQLSDLLSARMPIVEAVRVAGAAADRSTLWRASEQLARRLKEKIPLAPDGDLRFMPHAIVHLINLGASEGQTQLPAADALGDLSAIYHLEAQATARAAFWLIAPCALWATGMVVAITVVGLFMPLVSLILNLS